MANVVLYVSAAGNRGPVPPSTLPYNSRIRRTKRDRHIVHTMDNRLHCQILHCNAYNMSLLYEARFDNVIFCRGCEFFITWISDRRNAEKYKLGHNTPRPFFASCMGAHAFCAWPFSPDDFLQGPATSSFILFSLSARWDSIGTRIFFFTRFIFSLLFPSFPSPLVAPISIILAHIHSMP